MSFSTKRDDERPLLVIVNPRAGGGRCGRRAEPALERLRRAGLALEVRSTHQPWEAMQIARAGFGSGFRRFLVLGGDGTAFETLNGFLPMALDAGVDTELALLPLGTGNSFVGHYARATGVDPSELVLDALAQGRSRRCDVLRLERRSGDNLVLGSIALGFAARVAARVNRQLKPLGVAGYTLGVLLELLHLRAEPLHLSLYQAGRAESQRGAIVLAAIQNVSLVGGNMAMAPFADPSDGVAELVTVGPVGRLELLRTFPRIFQGSHLSHPAVSTRTFTRLVFHDEARVPVMVDGEVIAMTPQAVEVLPAALAIAI